MKEKDRKEVAKMIGDSIHGIAGDLMAYMNYWSDRLSVLEELHGVEDVGYTEFLDMFGSSEKIERRVIVHLESKGHHIIDDDEVEKNE